MQHAAGIGFGDGVAVVFDFLARQKRSVCGERVGDRRPAGDVAVGLHNLRQRAIHQRFGARDAIVVGICTFRRRHAVDRGIGRHDHGPVDRIVLSLAVDLGAADQRVGGIEDIRGGLAVGAQGDDGTATGFKIVGRRLRHEALRLRITGAHELAQLAVGERLGLFGAVVVDRFAVGHGGGAGDKIDRDRGPRIILARILGEPVHDDAILAGVGNDEAGGRGHAGIICRDALDLDVIGVGDDDGRPAACIVGVDPGFSRDDGILHGTAPRFVCPTEVLEFEYG